MVEQIKLDQAVATANRLAATYGDELGSMLYCEPRDTWFGPAWELYFDIVNGPRDWCWMVIADNSGPLSSITAVHFRPENHKSTPLPLIGCVLFIIAIIGVVIFFLS